MPIPPRLLDAGVLTGRGSSGALSPKALARQASDASGADYTAKLEDQVDQLLDEVSSLLHKVWYTTMANENSLAFPRL